VYGVNAVFILRKDCISWKKRLADAKNAVGPCQEELKRRVSGHTTDKGSGRTKTSVRSHATRCRS